MEQAKETIQRREEDLPAPIPQSRHPQFTEAAACAALHHCPLPQSLNHQVSHFRDDRNIPTPAETIQNSVSTIAALMRIMEVKEER